MEKPGNWSNMTMKNQPRVSPIIAAVSLFLASGPIPAAAQMNVRIGSGARGSSGVPAINGVVLPSAGAASNSPAALGLGGTLSAPRTSRRA